MAKESTAKSNSGEGAKPSGLFANQKIALLGAAVVLAIILGAAFILGQPQTPQQPFQPAQNAVKSDAASFSKALFNSNSIGIFMDLRGSQDGTLRQKILQCGADLTGNIASIPTFASKGMVISACDEKECLLSFTTTNTTLNATQAQVDSELGNTTYFHILGGSAKAPEFWQNRMDITVSAEMNSTCKLSVTEEIMPFKLNQIFPTESNVSSSNGTGQAKTDVPIAAENKSSELVNVVNPEDLGSGVEKNATNASSPPNGAANNASIRAAIGIN